MQQRKAQCVQIGNSFVHIANYMNKYSLNCTSEVLPLETVKEWTNFPNYV